MKFKSVAEEFPPKDQRLLVRFKHGVIDCTLVEEESSEKDGYAVGYTYIWGDREFYIDEWMLFSDFENALEGKKK
jgi:hypothetical protein